MNQAGAAGPATRIAMWSGPRTVSTALMRAWENRPDTAVTDEPLYAFYLDRTGLDHPGRDAVIASQPTDWQVVLAGQARGPLPGGAVIGYAKHMTHHLLPEVDRAALAPFRHAYLIRDPRELLASYARVRAEPTLADLGLRQQAEIFETFGGPVVDSRDLLAAPEGTLRALCQALGVPFDARDAGLAGRTAGQRRGVGTLLVRQRPLLHRLRPLPPAGRPAARPPRAPRGPVPALLRPAAPLPHHSPGRTSCFRSSMSATAT